MVLSKDRKKISQTPTGLKIRWRFCVGMTPASAATHSSGRLLFGGMIRRVGDADMGPKK